MHRRFGAELAAALTGGWTTLLAIEKRTAPSAVSKTLPGLGSRIRLVNTLRSSSTMRTLTTTTAACAATLASLALPARGQDTKSFEIYGFAQADYIQDFKRVDPAWQDTLRPAKIATTDC